MPKKRHCNEIDCPHISRCPCCTSEHWDNVERKETLAEAVKLKPTLTNMPVQCEATLQFEAYKYKSAKWSESHGGLAPTSCGNYASYKIAGKCLCRKHASMLALDILVGDYDGR